MKLTKLLFSDHSLSHSLIITEWILEGAFADCTRCLQKSCLNSVKKLRSILATGSVKVTFAFLLVAVLSVYTWAIRREQWIISDKNLFQGTSSCNERRTSIAIGWYFCNAYVVCIEYIATKYIFQEGGFDPKPETFCLMKTYCTTFRYIYFFKTSKDLFMTKSFLFLSFCWD